MKFTINRPVEVQASKIEIFLPVEEYDEARKESGSRCNPPGFDKRGEYYVISVSPEGKLLGLKPKECADKTQVWAKVRDAGIYRILYTFPDDSEGVLERRDYVPHGLIPGEYGDYIDLDIVDGHIANWPEKPDLSAFLREDED